MKTLRKAVPDVLSEKSVNLKDVQAKVATNVGPTERWLSMLSGGTLVAYGVQRSGWSKSLLAILGGGLILRGLTGFSMLNKAFKRNSANQSLKISTNVSRIQGDKGIKIRRSLTVNSTPEKLYAMWKDVEKAPLYMPMVQAVEKTGERTSYWIAESPTGEVMNWNAELLEDKPEQQISWHVHGKPLGANSGTVTFTPTPNDRGTIVTLEQNYFHWGNPLEQPLVKIAARVPEYATLETLRRFKEIMEAGEVPTIHGQPKVLAPQNNS